MSHTIVGANMSNPTAQRVYGEQCCERDHDHDGNCDIHKVAPEAVKTNVELQPELRGILHSDKDDGQVIELVIALYGKELDKANDMITHQREQLRLAHLALSTMRMGGQMVDLLPRVKKCLHRWAARYAESGHAKAHVKETVLLEQEIDECILR